MIVLQFYQTGMNTALIARNCSETSATTPHSSKTEKKQEVSKYIFCVAVLSQSHFGLIFLQIWT